MAAGHLVVPSRRGQRPENLLSTSERKFIASNTRTGMLLLLLTAGRHCWRTAYHPYSAERPRKSICRAVERILNPALFPDGARIFPVACQHDAVFPNLVAFSFRATHLPFENGTAGVATSLRFFLLLLACWQLSGILFFIDEGRDGDRCA